MLESYFYFRRSYMAEGSAQVKATGQLMNFCLVLLLSFMKDLQPAARIEGRSAEGLQQTRSCDSLLADDNEFMSDSSSVPANNATRTA